MVMSLLNQTTQFLLLLSPCTPKFPVWLDYSVCTYNMYRAYMLLFLEQKTGLLSSYFHSETGIAEALNPKAGNLYLVQCHWFG